MIIPDKNIKEKIKNIKLFLFDLDGVLVLRKDSDTNELLTCMTDFTKKLKAQNLYAGIITGRTNDPLTKTLASIDNCLVVTSSFNKVDSVEKILKDLNLKFENILYIGDDMLDIPLLQKVGIAIAPSSARREVKRVVDLTLDITINGSILHSVFDVVERLKND